MKIFRFFVFVLTMASAVAMSQRASAQVYDKSYAKSLALSVGTSSPTSIVTLVGPSSLTSGAYTLTLPSSISAGGILQVATDGTLSLLSLGLGNLPLGTANQFMTSNGVLNSWEPLSVNSTDISGNGVGTALGIASTAGADIVTAINDGSSKINVANGGTGAASFTSGDLLVGNGIGAITPGPVWTSGTTTLTGNISGTAQIATTVATTGVAGTGPYYPLFVSATSGNQAVDLDVSGFTYNAATNALSLGVAGPSGVTGSLVLLNSGNANATTIEAGTSAPVATYLLPITAPAANQVLENTSSSSPYQLQWTNNAAASGVNYNVTAAQATVASTGLNYLFNVGYNGTATGAPLGAVISSTNNVSGGTAATNSATGLTINATANGSGTTQGIPTGLAITISGDTIGPAIVLHNASSHVSGDSVHDIITTTDNEIETQETGDLYGTSILRIQNRTGANGAIFQTISNGTHDSTDLVDWGFMPGNGAQSNIRLEARHYWGSVSPPHVANEYLRSSANITATSPEEFQYFFGTTGATPEYVMDVGMNATMIERGNFGIGYGTNSAGGDTAAGSPRARLDVHSPGSYFGGLSDAGYSGASNIILSDSGTSGHTAPYIGAMEFQGANDGLSTFAAGSQGSTYINYTWPTTQPGANQVLAAPASIGGSGTSALPYTVALTWANASGSSTGVSYNITSAAANNNAVAVSTNYLFDVSYASSTSNDNAIGALINSATSTGTGNATGLTIDASTHNAETAIGLALGVTGGATNTDIQGTGSNWTISSLGTITFGTGGTNSAPNITSTAGTAMYVQAGTTTATNTAGPAVTLQAGTGNGTGIGGGLELWGGTPGATSANAAGGFASLDGANSADGVGGADSVNAGNGGANGAGGTVYVAAGNGAGSGVGGAVTLNAGLAGTTGAGGGITIAASNGGSSATSGAGAGGSIAISAGNGEGATNVNGGTITLTPGTAVGTGTHGYIDLAGPVYAAGSSSTGTSGQVLTSEGASASPQWTTVSGGSFSGYRAGSTSISSGSSSATVTFSSAMSSANYAVSLVFTNAPDLTTNSGWGYLYVSSKTTSGFTINYETSDGASQNVPSGQTVDIDYTALPNQ